MQLETVIRALADPTRLRILRLTAAMELAVGELAQVLGQSQPRVSRHVAILCDAGLVEKRREGSWVFLRRPAPPHAAPESLRAIARLLAADEDADFAATCAADSRRLADIRAGRERDAEDYFARHATEWDSLRAILAPAGAVEAALLSALGAIDTGTVLDIGTGTGRIAELLAGRSDHVTGLDKSPEMLRLARARLQHLPAEHVDFVQGEFAALPFTPASFDTVVFHQALHYAQEPALAVAEAARVCREGGRVAIVDLAAHEREDLRRTHAHARLGFSDAQMAQLLAAHGFHASDPVTVEGGELAVKIWIATRLADTVSPLPTRRPADRPRKVAAR